MKSNSRTDLCVTFDLWETLIFDDPDFDEARARMRCEGLRSVLGSHGVQLPSADLRRAYEDIAPTLQSVWNRHEEVPITDQVRMIAERAAGKSLTLSATCVESLERAYVDPVLSIPPRLSRDAAPVLAAVRDRGSKIGLISNTGRSPGEALRKLLDAYSILNFFDATVFSNEVMRRKPNHIIFDRAAQLLKTEKPRIVHVGDNPEADFWGAKDAGMQAILLDEVRPEVSRWGPNSLYALGRANMRRDVGNVDAKFRVKSLLDVPELLDSLF